MTPNSLKRLLILYFVAAFLHANGQTASFTMPASVCTNTPVTIANASAGASTYYWSFCSADLTQTPLATNFGILTTPPQEPVFIDIVEDNGNYYGLMTIHYPGNLARLDFGSSLLNTPTVTDLGNFGGIIYPGYGTEGIQVVKVNGNWTAIIVGGSVVENDDPHIMKVDFGPSITNPTPVATDWGNVGNLLQLPIQLYLFQEAGNWHGFTVNSEGNTLTRFDWGADFSNPPTAVNLGNPGGLLNYPCGVTAVNDAGSWHIFISNGNYNVANPVVRLDFGSSLLNTFTTTGLGNLGNVIISARTLSFFEDCDQAVGFLTDGTNHSLVRLDFHNNILSVPTATNLGNLAGWNFPHSLSPIFRVGPDLYSLVPDAFAGTVTRLRFPGCTNASIPGSTVANPPPVSWSQPGTYSVNLTIDEGLPTQTSYCQSIVVGQGTPFSLGDDTTLCTGDTLVLRYSGPPATYAWQDGSGEDTFTVRAAGQYSLTATQAAGCTASSAIAISYQTRPTVSTIPAATICYGDSLTLTTQVQRADSVSWTPATGLNYAGDVSPIAKPGTSGSYIVTAWNGQCPTSDTVAVTVNPDPVISIMGDTVLCVGAATQLSAGGAINYSWSPSPGLSATNIADPLATPGGTVSYYVKGIDANSCTGLDSIHIRVKSPDVFTLKATPPAICPGDSSQLIVSGADLTDGDSYTWSSPAGAPDAASIYVSPAVPSTYSVTAMDKVCNRSETLSATIGILSQPVLSVTKSNDIGCIYGEATLNATGGIRYEWVPATGLSDPFSAAPVVRTDTTTQYLVLGVGANGCTSLDSITVFVSKAGGNIGFPVANAFTPNGDGANDRFGIKYWGYVSEFQLNIYNRQGMLVFASANPDQGWDGTFNGHPQPAGTYVYTIKANTLCGVTFKKGTLELIR